MCTKHSKQHKLNTNAHYPPCTTHNLRAKWTALLTITGYQHSAQVSEISSSCEPPYFRTESLMSCTAKSPSSPSTEGIVNIWPSSCGETTCPNQRHCKTDRHRNDCYYPMHEGISTYTTVIELACSHLCSTLITKHPHVVQVNRSHVIHRCSLQTIFKDVQCRIGSAFIMENPS